MRRRTGKALILAVSYYRDRVGGAEEHLHNILRSLDLPCVVIGYVGKDRPRKERLVKLLTTLVSIARRLVKRGYRIVLLENVTYLPALPYTLPLLLPYLAQVRVIELVHHVAVRLHFQNLDNKALALALAYAEAFTYRIVLALLQRILKHRLWIATVSYTTLRDLAKLGLDPRRVIPIPNIAESGSVDHEQSRTCISIPFLLTVSRVGKYKQYTHAILLMHLLKHLNTRILLYMVGTCCEDSMVHRLVKKYRLEGWVVPLGRVSQELLEKLYANCLAVVHYSKFEGFGRVILEAYIHGKPVLCYENVHGISEACKLLANCIEGNLKTHAKWIIKNIGGRSKTLFNRRGYGLLLSLYRRGIDMLKRVAIA